jgi:hypothetical protein
MTVINETLAAYIARERARKEIGKTKWPSRLKARRKSPMMFTPQFVVESVRKGGKKITTQPRPLAQAQRRFDAFKKLNGSTGTVAATLYRQFRNDTRMLIEAWAAAEKPPHNPYAKLEPAVKHITTRPWTPLKKDGSGEREPYRLPTLTVHEIGHVYRRQDATLAVAELFRIAASKNMRMIGMRLVKQILREYGGGASQLPELLSKYYEPVTKKALEAALELVGKDPINLTTKPYADPYVKMAAAVAAEKTTGERIVGKSPVLGMAYSKVNDVYGLGTGHPVNDPFKLGPEGNAKVAANLRAAAPERTQDAIARRYRVPSARLQEEYHDGTRPLFALYFRLKALADALSSNPALVKLAADARATNSMDEFDRKAHCAAREMANLLLSSANIRIRRYLQQESERNQLSSVPTAMGRVRDLLDKIGGLTKSFDFGVEQRLKAAAMAREALAIWVTALSAMPYKRFPTLSRGWTN